MKQHILRSSLQLAVAVFLFVACGEDPEVPQFNMRKLVPEVVEGEMSYRLNEFYRFTIDNDIYYFSESAPGLCRSTIGGNSQEYMWPYYLNGSLTVADSRVTSDDGFTIEWDFINEAGSSYPIELWDKISKDVISNITIPACSYAGKGYFYCDQVPWKDSAALLEYIPSTKTVKVLECERVGWANETLMFSTLNGIYAVTYDGQIRQFSFAGNNWITLDGGEQNDPSLLRERLLLFGSVLSRQDKFYAYNAGWGDESDKRVIEVSEAPNAQSISTIPVTFPYDYSDGGGYSMWGSYPLFEKEGKLYLPYVDVIYEVEASTGEVTILYLSESTEIGKLICVIGDSLYYVFNGLLYKVAL